MISRCFLSVESRYANSLCYATRIFSANQLSLNKKLLRTRPLIDRPASYVILWSAAMTSI